MARVIAISGAPEARSRVLLVAAAGFALIAAVLVFVALQSSSNDGGTRRSAGFIPVVVAARALDPNTTISADMLKLQPVPPDVVLSGSFERTDALVGQVIRYPVSQGQQLTASVLGAASIPNDDDLSYAVPPGLRAVAVEVSEVTGVGGLLLPGNSVDVIGVFDANTTGTARAVTLLQNIVVLAVGQEAQRPAPRPLDGSAADSAAAGKDAERQPEARTVTLAVGPQDAQLLALAQDRGKLWLSLRAAGDVDSAPLGEQLLPISPEVE